MIELAQVSIRQGEFELTDIEWSVENNEYAVLMGPTGCGKTTLVEAICGLRPIRSGRIVINDVDVTQVDCSQRGIGYVPQDRTLFPTVRVDRQIEFGMTVRNVPAPERKQRRDELAKLVGIDHLLKRYPRGLSGGEQQRVALARALSFRPQVLCLDEPLSALDERTHGTVVELLKTIHQIERVTVLHITHNDEEAASLGTACYRLFKGVIQRDG